MSGGPHRANPPDVAEILARAEAGNRLALMRAYGMAAAWLREGKAPPEPLASWIGWRLEHVAQLMRRARLKDGPGDLDAEVSVALGVRRKGQRGRPRKHTLAARSR